MVWHKHRNKYILLVGSAIIIFFIFYFFGTTGKSRVGEYGTVEINGKNISVENVSNSYDQYLGLSNRDNLCADCGMLFVFPDKKIEEFVMRNMKFPLDIVFISDNKIINIAENLSPEGVSPVNFYTSSAPVNNVLEINAGYAQKNGIKAGDEIIIKNN